MTELLIMGAQLPDGTTTDLLIKDSVFVDPAEASASAERLDAAGLIALPGLVDPHTHLREPGKEDAETIGSGTLAAARGGFTAVMAMANTTPVTDNADVVRYVQETAAKVAHAEVFSIGAITKGLESKELSDLGPMAELGVRMFSDDGKCVSDSKLMREAFRFVRAFDGVLAQHSQDFAITGVGGCCHEGEWSDKLELPAWPAVAESVIVARDVELARDTDSRLHVCHASTAETVEVLRWAKKRGIKVTAEATPHHLLLTTPLLADADPRFKVNPPLRPQEDVDAIRDALADGTIDMVGTDHAPHPARDKDKPFAEAAFGMVGLEQALGILIESLVKPGLLSWEGLADRMSYAPGRLIGLTGQGQPIRVGGPANLTLIDPEQRATVERTNTSSKSTNNPYHGRELPDPVQLTVWAGKVTYRR